MGIPLGVADAKGSRKLPDTQWQSGHRWPGYLHAGAALPLEDYCMEFCCKVPGQPTTAQTRTAVGEKKRELKVRTSVNP